MDKINHNLHRKVHHAKKIPINQLNHDPAIKTIHFNDEVLQKCHDFHEALNKLEEFLVTNPQAYVGGSIIKTLIKYIQQEPSHKQMQLLLQLFEKIEQGLKNDESYKLHLATSKALMYAAENAIYIAQNWQQAETIFSFFADLIPIENMDLLDSAVIQLSKLSKKHPEIKNDIKRMVEFINDIMDKYNLPLSPLFLQHLLFMVDYLKTTQYILNQPMIHQAIKQVEIEKITENMTKLAYIPNLILQKLKATEEKSAAEQFEKLFRLIEQHQTLFQYIELEQLHFLLQGSYIGFENCEKLLSHPIIANSKLLVNAHTIALVSIILRKSHNDNLVQKTHEFLNWAIFQPKGNYKIKLDIPALIAIFSPFNSKYDLTDIEAIFGDCQKNFQLPKHSYEYLQAIKELLYHCYKIEEFQYIAAKYADKAFKKVLAYFENQDHGQNQNIDCSSQQEKYLICLLLQNYIICSPAPIRNKMFEKITPIIMVKNHGKIFFDFKRLLNIFTVQKQDKAENAVLDLDQNILKNSIVPRTAFVNDFLKWMTYTGQMSVEHPLLLIGVREDHKIHAKYLDQIRLLSSIEDKLKEQPTKSAPNQSNEKVQQLHKNNSKPGSEHYNPYEEMFIPKTKKKKKPITETLTEQITEQKIQSPQLSEQEPRKLIKETSIITKKNNSEDSVKFKQQEGEQPPLLNRVYKKLSNWFAEKWFKM